MSEFLAYILRGSFILVAVVAPIILVLAAFFIWQEVSFRAKMGTAHSLSDYTDCVREKRHE